MRFFTRQRALWLALNLAAAIVVPVAFGWWLDHQVRASDAAMPEGFDPGTVILVFTAAWAGFLLLLNVTMALFIWLRGR
jgi:F0F1-type ATP synthase assembly protein I